MSSLLERIKNEIVLLDGSMGALLQQEGLPAGYAPDLWNLERPQAIMSVHERYISAGSRIVITNTFGATKRRLAEFDAESKMSEINEKAVAIAREAYRKLKIDGFVAGDVGPLGGMVEPYGDIGFDEAVELFAAQMRVLVKAGVDAIIIETMFDIQEMKTALIAANDVRGKIPVIASMTFAQGGITDTGTDPATAAAILEGLGADILAVNCSVGPDEMLDVVNKMHAACRLPIAVQPNAGLPVIRDGKTVFPADAQYMAGFVRKFVDAGANIIGGCCGTTPEYIALAAKAVSGVRPAERPARMPFRFTSRSGIVTAGPGRPFLKIGEKINPTGRKKLAESIAAGKMDLVLEEARKETESGAMALDVNVGVPLVDEPAMMKRAVTAVQNIVDLPLVIDSSENSAIEAGLKVYSGRALVNSVNAEHDRLEGVLPLVKRYGASAIILAAGDYIPESAAERVKAVEAVLRRAEEFGVSKDRFIVDCLALVVSAMQNGARETLELIRIMSRDFGLPTMAGVSNVSFGLPNRPLIHNTFLSLAIGSGLDAAIVNPYDDGMHRAVAAASLFAGRDDGCMAYIDYEKLFPAAQAVTQGQPQAAQRQPDAQAKPPLFDPATIRGKVFRAVMEGEKDSIVALLTDAVENHKESPLALVADVMTPAIRELGDLFGQRKKFIPHLVAAADSMQHGVGYLQPLMEKETSGLKPKGKIVFATVKGDIHDIGKNICIVMLRNFGFKVIDLGRNVPGDEIIAAAEKEGADIIALSALMTTTMNQMKLVVEEVRRQGHKYKVMVGGAAVTAKFAREIGADAYGKDVGDIADTAEKLVKI